MCVISDVSSMHRRTRHTFVNEQLKLAQARISSRSNTSFSIYDSLLYDDRLKVNFPKICLMTVVNLCHLNSDGLFLVKITIHYISKQFHFPKAHLRCLLHKFSSDIRKNFGTFGAQERIRRKSKKKL